MGSVEADGLVGVEFRVLVSMTADDEGSMVSDLLTSAVGLSLILVQAGVEGLRGILKGVTKRFLVRTGFVGVR